MNTSPTVIVVGGGLAGLAAATTAARAGSRVTLLEARSELGGRARTAHHAGFSFNQGPHALYRGGVGMAILRDFGVRPEGALSPLTGAAVAIGGELRPTSRPSTLGRSGARALRAVAAPGAVARARGLTVSEWMSSLPDDHTRARAAAFIRLTSYGNEFEHIDAAAALLQIRRAAHGVLYLHGGWGALVTSLRQRALEAGVEIRSGLRAVQVVADHAGVVVRTADRELQADSVVIAAGGAAQVDGLLCGASPMISRWAGHARPSFLACLDVALWSMPNRRHTMIIGVDEPTYCIAHSRSARLAPAGGALFHVARYGALGPDGSDDPAALRASLESQLDRAQPGWRDVLVDARFGRRLVAAHDVPRLHADPTERPDIVVPELPRVFVAGDWITTNGQLADAALDSGVRAGRAAASALSRSVVREDTAHA